MLLCRSLYEKRKRYSYPPRPDGPKGWLVPVAFSVLLWLDLRLLDSLERAKVYLVPTSKKNQNQSNCLITFDTQLKTALIMLINYTVFLDGWEVYGEIVRRRSIDQYTSVIYNIRRSFSPANTDGFPTFVSLV